MGYVLVLHALLNDSMIEMFELMLFQLVDISDDPWGDDHRGGGSASNSLQHTDPFASIDATPAVDPWLPPPPTSKHHNTSATSNGNNDPWKTNGASPGAAAAAATNPWSSAGMHNSILHLVVNQAMSNVGL